MINGGNNERKIGNISFKKFKIGFIMDSIKLEILLDSIEENDLEVVMLRYPHKIKDTGDSELILLQKNLVNSVTEFKNRFRDRLKLLSDDNGITYKYKRLFHHLYF